MLLKLISHLLRKARPLLLLHVVDDSLRYVLRQKNIAKKMGEISLVMQGKMFDVALARNTLLKQLGSIKAQVAILLPSSSTHIHFMNVPNGLDTEESEYQVNRHIAQELGLAVNDVYYDWTVLPNSIDQGQVILLALARQLEIAQYAQLVAKTSLRINWVCAEPLVWANAYQKHDESHGYAVCQVERSGLHLFWFDALGRIQSLNKKFASSRTSQQYIFDEIQAVLQQIPEASLKVLYVLGSAIDWAAVLPQLQSLLQTPVRFARLAPEVGSDVLFIYAGLWHLSEQIMKTTDR